MLTTTTTASAQTNTGRKHWIDAWHVTPSVNRDYDFIDGLRGVAILMVIVAHHFYVNPNAGVLVRSIGTILGTGSHGVTLFYALSGFLISWPFWKRKVAAAEKTMPRGYVQRRFWKIYPPLVFSLFVLTPLYVLDHSDWSYLVIAVKWLIGLPFVVPISGKFNPVMWTLVIEVQFYAVLPLVFLCLKRVSARASLVIVTGLFFVAPLLMRVITGKAATFHPNIDPNFPAALDVFCFGILIAGLENLGYIKKTFVRWGVAGVVLWPLALLVAAWIGMHPAEDNFVTSELLHGGLRFAAACLILFIANPRHAIARVLCAPWLRWCGIISYEWYLLHQPLAMWTREHFGPASGSPIRYALIIGIPLVSSLILSAMVYRFFSLPLLRYGRGKNQA